MKIKAVVAAMLLASPVAAQDVKIGIAAEAYPPFASPDAAGNWVGWEVDFINAVCAAGENGLRCRRGEEVSAGRIHEAERQHVALGQSLVKGDFDHEQARCVELAKRDGLGDSDLAQAASFAAGLKLLKSLVLKTAEHSTKK